jgi:hypothetical protein
MDTFDAVMITDVMNPQGTYDAIVKKVDCVRILTLDLLHISTQAQKKGAE